jgi:hypothetical protein
MCGYVTLWSCNRLVVGLLPQSAGSIAVAKVSQSSSKQAASSLDCVAVVAVCLSLCVVRGIIDAVAR